jgi:hypothetical protein
VGDRGRMPPELPPGTGRRPHAAGRQDRRPKGRTDTQIRTVRRVVRIPALKCYSLRRLADEADVAGSYEPVARAPATDHSGEIAQLRDHSHAVSHSTADGVGLLHAYLNRGDLLHDLAELTWQLSKAVDRNDPKSEASAPLPPASGSGGLPTDWTTLRCKRSCQPSRLTTVEAALKTCSQRGYSSTPHRRPEHTGTPGYRSGAVGTASTPMSREAP